MVESGLFYKIYLYGYLIQFYAYPVCNNRLKGRELLYGDYTNCNFPIIFLSEDDEYIKNKRMTDFLNAGIDRLVVSDKVIEVLSDNNITGWKTYPIEVYDKNENYIGGYHGLSITGRCEAVKPSLAEPWIDSYGENTLKGMPLDLDNTWDGSDIFLLPGTGFVFMSKRAKKIIEKDKITNITFDDIADYIDTLFKGKPFWENNEDVKISE